MSKKFLTVCLNPTIQKTLTFRNLRIDDVNRAVAVRTDASGKGVNVTRVLSQCGADAVHLTHAGGADGDWFLSLCASDGLSVEWVNSESDVRFCTTVIDMEASTATELVEESAPVGPETERLLLARFDRILPSIDALVVSGTKAAGYSDTVIPEMVRRAAARGMPIVLDIKGKDLAASLPFRPAVVKPNLSEFLATCPEPEGTDPAALRAHVQACALDWKERYSVELVITRGNRPVWFSEDGKAADEPVVPVKAVNPTGSGDSFTAGLAIVLAAGGTLREAVREGARLGALNAGVLKPGSILSV